MSSRRARLAPFWIASGMLLAPAAGADWHGTKPYQVKTLIDGNVIHDVDTVEELQPDDEVYRIFVGDDDATPVAGEVTVVGQGPGVDRQIVGQWYVDYGTGNVQSVFGDGAFSVGGGTPPDSSSVLEILNSDVRGDFYRGNVGVANGTARIRAASKIGNLGVGTLGSAYVVEGSSTTVLTTSVGSYLSIDSSTVSQVGVQKCDLRGTAVIVNSILHCGAMDTSNGADIDVSAFPGQAAFHIQNALRIVGASVSVSSSVASSGSLEVTGNVVHATSLHVAGTDWTNAGDLTFTRAADGPIELHISGGSQFHQQGTLRVYNASGDGLVVSGGGTELEAEGNLLVGQYFLATPQPVPATMTVADGAVVIVHGTFVLGVDAVLDLQPGGTIYADATEINGTILENGGALVVPEPASLVAGLGACTAFAALARRRRRRR